MRPDEQIGESAIKAASQVRHANTVSVIDNVDEETQMKFHFLSSLKLARMF